MSRSERTIRVLVASATGLLGLVAAVAVPIILARPAQAQQPTQAQQPVPSTQEVRLDNGLARTPPMGWNNWNAFGCDLDERLIRDTADRMVKDGWRDAGYQYVNIDDCWMATQRDAAGNLVADPEKFPSGIAALADYVHQQGLKLGIYQSAGYTTCYAPPGGRKMYPGSLGYEVKDANLFASWGVDYLKYDNCSSPLTGIPAITRYTAMRDALLATGRPIVFSICNWGHEDPWVWGPSTGNAWRTTGDINVSWERIDHIFRLNAVRAYAAKVGAWNDPDMLEVGNQAKRADEKNLTPTEQRSHFSLWAMMAAPLLAGTDLRNASAATKDIYLNRDVIAVNQDSLGEQAREIYADHYNHTLDARRVLVKRLANGDRAVALYNRGTTDLTMSTSANAIGMPAAASYTVDDLWSAATPPTTTNAISARVPAHGTVLLRVSAAGGGAGGWTRALVGKQSGRCLDNPGFSHEDKTPAQIFYCAYGANQQWTYTAKKELQVLGKCLDAYDNGVTPGTKVQLYTCNGGANQKWNVNADGTITGVQSHLCLDVEDNRTENSTPVLLWTCKNGAANQNWSLR